MDVKDIIQKLENRDLEEADIQSIFDIAIEFFEQQNYQDSVHLFVFLYNKGYLCGKILKFIKGRSYKENENTARNFYEKNARCLNEYPYLIGNRMCSFNELPVEIIYFSNEQYIIFERNKNKFSQLYKIENEDKCFFQNTDKPLLIKNEQNWKNIKYLWDNVRRSEDYGNDNHVYLYYDSFAEFCAFLQVMDITTYLVDEKFVFLFDKEQLEKYYPIDFKKLYGIDYTVMNYQPIRVSEIKRLFVGWFELTMSGNYFLSGVLDYHKNLLTIKEFGLAGFDYLYQNVFKDRTVSEVAQHLSVNKDPLIYSELTFLIKAGLTTDEIKVPTLENIFTQLKIIFGENIRPTKLEWFKSLFLAYAVSLGRKFEQRIVPAIVFHTHGMGYPIQIEDMYDVFKGFEYFRAISIIRRPIVGLGARVNLFEKEERGQQNYIKCINDYVLADYGLMSKSNYRLYLKPDDEFLPYRKVIRFEDLKLHPKPMLMSMCEFFDIEWDEILLKTTANGIENTMKMENGRNVGGFDKKPVYNRHEECFSAFDYYRLELVKSDYYRAWGYKPVYYNDFVKYSKRDILKMFEVKFKCEEFYCSQQQKESNLKERDRMYTFVSNLIDRPKPVDENGIELIPIPWLKPKLDLIEVGDLYE